MVAALDLWTLFVQYVFGGVFVATIGIVILIFIIMGVLGRTSIYSTIVYCIMFISAMSLGYGFVLINFLITLLVLLATWFSWKGYFDRS